MNPEELLNLARQVTLAGTDMTLVLPKGFKRPKGFPRGTKLSENIHGRAYSFEPYRIVKFLQENKLLEKDDE